MFPFVRAAGWLALVGLAGSSLTTAAASRLLVSEEAVVEVAARPAATAPDEPERPQQVVRPPAPSERGSSERAPSAAYIVEHNPFCPTCRPAPALQPGAQPQLALTPTELPLILLATMESDDPADSMASIADSESRSTGVFGVNEQLRAGVVIAEIRRGRVLLRTHQGLRTLDLPDPEQPKAKPKKKPKPVKRGSREIPGAREAINCSGHDCTVDRKFVDKLLANPAQLTRQAKLVPAVKDGDIRGFRLARLRRGTLLRLLGLHNGDTLLAVNGIKLDSMDQAVGLYTKLRRASNLNVTVERKGKVFDTHIAIR
ncbi:type II secretion system protein GspC [Enhygromyxa salina]|uniref:Type II secretion system protein C n=1 Tax=Enhygromyxa salina TaxID=215803 RepID=A0A2S9XN79_9BACT|nr:type II secretion system protein GspC [Enhygromyxa salina]PRP94315.1 Type II secretion system protein C [Enhygromyxa salina]